jgi:hypothetical protein
MDGRGFGPIRMALHFPHGENQQNLHVPLIRGLQSPIHNLPPAGCPAGTEAKSLHVSGELN